MASLKRLVHEKIYLLGRGNAFKFAGEVFAVIIVNVAQ
jgi:hypothetical protein